MVTKVKLRQKKISGNRHSLYLDFYPAIPKNGKLTRRDFLGLNLFDTPKTDSEKNHNRETLELAQQIWQKRTNELNKPEIYNGFELQQLKIKQQAEASFIDYFRGLVEKQKVSIKDGWLSTFNYLETYTSGKGLKFEDLNEAFCNDFKAYLLSTQSKRSNKANLANNTAGSYFNKFKAGVKQAFRDGCLQTDLSEKITGIKEAETHRNFLTLEEMNALVKTDCVIPVLKNAAIFSALTGLRFSDILKLVWAEIEYIEGQGFFIQFTQQKTGGVEMMPISEQAFSLLGERKEPTDKIFKDLKYSDYMNRYLYQWIGAAGISKHITFHSFRHTYATLQLSLGSDIYTVSKMLGHRDLKTTARYAKIIDATKRLAADRIKLDL